MSHQTSLESMIVVAIDAKKDATKDRWIVYTHGGRKPTSLDAVEWARMW